MNNLLWIKTIEYPSFSGNCCCFLKVVQISTKLYYSAITVYVYPQSTLFWSDEYKMTLQMYYYALVEYESIRLLFNRRMTMLVKQMKFICVLIFEVVIEQYLWSLTLSIHMFLFISNQVAKSLTLKMV